MRAERTVLGLGEVGRVVTRQGVRRTGDPRPYSWVRTLLLTHRPWACVHILFLSRIALGFVAMFALQPVHIPYLQGLCRDCQEKPETANSSAHSSQAGSLTERSMSGDSRCGGHCGKLEGACPF